VAGHDTDERPQFARGTAVSANATVELRGECPRSIVDVLDAISMARDKTRTALVNEILGAWAEKVIHEHSLLSRVVGVTPPRAEGTGTSAGGA
jgi:hypothetical protein